MFLIPLLQKVPSIIQSTKKMDSVFHKPLREVRLKLFSSNDNRIKHHNTEKSEWVQAIKGDKYSHQICPEMQAVQEEIGRNRKKQRIFISHIYCRRHLKM